MAYTVKAEASRTVIAQDGVDRFAFNDDGSFELLTPASNPTGNKVPTAGQLPFTKEYTSPEQTIAAAGALTLTHGLGTTPKFWQRYLICKVAEVGYSVGDVTDVSGTQDASVGYGLSIVPDATNLNCRYGNSANTFFVLNKSTGLPSNITNANWRLIVRAWA